MILLKGQCGEQEQESIHDLNISEQIRDQSMRKLFANHSQKDNYLLNTAAAQQQHNSSTSEAQQQHNNSTAVAQQKHNSNKTVAATAPVQQQHSRSTPVAQK